MYVSALLGSSFITSGTMKLKISSSSRSGLTSLSPLPLIECSSRPQKKATAHHRKTRPKKSQPWDIKRTPTVYAPLPPLPPDWTLFSAATAAAATESVVDEPKE
ncbi:hypothetical protein GIB67_015261 [Kingdonia uniflora]|uniref:50S ribosomal protein 6, chloroplastic n=1 Tax=Kingdonia uniflora TaxID=39325 RepID=A0A7J7MSR3_9MAGN|nr:hypothetical protein GIB67_015261 [Kingdonia uniflora]